MFTPKPEWTDSINDNLRLLHDFFDLIWFGDIDLEDLDTIV